MMALMGLRYLLLLLIFPAYFIALSRRRWSTIPLWLVSTGIMLTQFLMAVRQGAAFGTGAADGSLVYVGEMTKIMLIPIVVQIAAVLRGMGIGVGNQANTGPRRLVEVFDATER
jgi:hypothetical protein